MLQVNKLYAPSIGGIETVVRDIAEGLADRTDMRVLVCQPKGRRGEERFGGVRVTRAGSFGTWSSLPLSVDFFRLFYRRSREADIVQLHYPFPPADLALWLFGCKGKTVIWWHSDIVRQKWALKLLRPFIRHSLKKADSIIVAAKETISSSAFLPQYASKCKVIPFGLDFEAHKLPAAPYSLTSQLRQPGYRKLLFVGRLVYYKGAPVLIKAMEGVKNAELFIVGSGPLEKPLKAAVRQAALEDKVHFLGTLSRDDLLGAFSDCDLLVFPSCANSEAFGLTQIEAMYYGKPVINTNLPTAVPYVSPSGETGLTVPVGDAQALTDAINTLAQNDSLRETYGKNAAARVRNLFDRRQMLDTLYNHYQSLMGCP